MSHLELNDLEQEALVEVLKSFLSELRTEVVHTDRYSYKEHLKEQEDVVKRILGKLDHA
ncbi:MAG TPA: hypothetical protein VIF82_01995 [Burkholderiaceae bacterium]|jgi:hypothetical protein